MLSQVLQREGNTSTIDTRFGASRLKSVDPDMSSASVVVIAYLGSDKLPFFLRILVRRVRSHMPDALIVAGFWSLSDNTKMAEQWGSSIGADHVGTTISEVAALCAGTESSTSRTKSARPEHLTAPMGTELSSQFGAGHRPLLIGSP